MEILRELNMLSVLVRVILSLVLGGILGLERGRKNRPAGFRTYMLVCLGAALVMMTNQYVTQYFGTSDPVRMGAQVISGIGFLGAGTIIVTGRNQIKGITTAAGLWTAACSGLAIGIGFYEGALVGGLTILLIMTVFQRVDGYIRNHAVVIDLYLEFEPGGNFSDFLQHARAHDFEVDDVQLSKNKLNKESGPVARVTARSLVRRTHGEMAEILAGAPGVDFLEEI